MLSLMQTDWIPRIPLAEWTESVVDWVTDTFEGFFDFISAAVDIIVGALQFALTAPPALLTVAEKICGLFGHEKSQVCIRHWRFQH